MATATEANLLVRWDDVLSHPARHESGMVAGLLHLALLLLILLSPRIFPEKQMTLEEVEQQLTLLYLPSDLLQVPVPRTEPNLTDEERRRAVVRTPFTVDPEELRRVLPPPPPLPPGRSSNLPSLPSGEGGEERTTGEAREERRNQIARLQDVPGLERPTDQPRLPLPSTRPGRTLDEMLRQGPPGTGGPGLSPGDLGYPLEPNFNTPYPVILSDTRGVDFGPYLVRLLRDVRRNWYAVIPESVRVLGEQGRVVIVFTILKDGSVPFGQPKLVQSAGRSHLDRPALGAIRAAQPFPTLPEEFTGEHIVLQFTFLYNLPLDYTGP